MKYWITKILLDQPVCSQQSCPWRSCFVVGITIVNGQWSSSSFPTYFLSSLPVVESTSVVRSGLRRLTWKLSTILCVESIHDGLTATGYFIVTTNNPFNFNISVSNKKYNILKYSHQITTSHQTPNIVAKWAQK